MREFRRCESCNKLYIATRSNQRYCSLDCRKLGDRIKACEQRREAREKKKKKRNQDLVKIDEMARQAGMTYGKYVSLHGL